MDIYEHYMTCLAEEATEVGQRACKALRFGIDDVQDGHTKNNAERLVDEIHDLIAIAILLEQKGILKNVVPTSEIIIAKRDRIHRYMSLALRNGALRVDEEPIL